MPPPTLDPSPEHILLLREMLRIGSDQANAIRDISAYVQHQEATLVRLLTDHETASVRRQEAIQRVADAMERAQTAREEALAKAEAEALARVEVATKAAAADRTEAAALWWRVARVAGYVMLPIALGLAARYAPDALAESAAVEATP